MAYSNISDRIEKQILRRLADAEVIALAPPLLTRKPPSRKDCLLLLGAKEWELLGAYSVRIGGPKLPATPFTPETGRIEFRQVQVFLVDDPDFLEVVVT